MLVFFVSHISLKQNQMLIFLRFPFVCVSIGLTIGKVPVVGVVFNPIMDEVIDCVLDPFNGSSCFG